MKKRDAGVAEDAGMEMCHDDQFHETEDASGGGC